MKSIIFNTNSNLDLISDIIKQGMIKAENEYGFNDSDCNAHIMWRQWLSNNDYNSLINSKDRDSLINQALRS